MIQEPGRTVLIVLFFRNVITCLCVYIYFMMCYIVSVMYSIAVELGYVLSRNIRHRNGRGEEGCSGDLQYDCI
jgi:hypothetical protein